MTRRYPSPEELIRHLNLAPLEIEGGWFAQSYVSEETLPASSLPSRYAGERALATVIYFLVTHSPEGFSALHRLKTDEVWHFYLGDPAEILLLYPDGSDKRVIMGNSIFRGHNFQLTVPRGVWQGCRLLPDARKGAGYALFGTSMAPGFHPGDFELGERDALIADYPGRAALIGELTRG